MNKFTSFVAILHGTNQWRMPEVILTKISGWSPDKKLDRGGGSQIYKYGWILPLHTPASKWGKNLIFRMSQN